MPVCTCEECLHYTYKDVDGTRIAGREVEAGELVAHAYAAKMKRKLEKSQRRPKSFKKGGGKTKPKADENLEDEDMSEGEDDSTDGHMGHTIFRATLQDRETQGELAVRPRDLKPPVS